MIEIKLIKDYEGNTCRFFEHLIHFPSDVNSSKYFNDVGSSFVLINIKMTIIYHVSQVTMWTGFMLFRKYIEDAFNKIMVMNVHSILKSNNIRQYRECYNLLIHTIKC